MSLLTILGVASMVFVAAFTWRAYRQPDGVGQSPRSAIIEAWLSIVIGFSFNYALNLVVIPLAIDGADCRLNALSNFWMGWVFTTASIVRQYAVRRWVNNRLHAVATRLGR